MMTNNEILKKIESGRQYRKMILAVDEVVEEGSRMVRGYATTFDEPYTLWETENFRFDEKVAPDAFESCNMDDVIMQYDHSGRVFARCSNGTLKLTRDAHGLLVEADLGGTERGRQLYEEIKGGYTNKMSFGFTVDEDDLEETTENNKAVYLRTIRKIGKLYDVSAVSLPANDGTEISARAFCDGVIAEVEAERLRAERAKTIEEMERRIKEIMEA